MEGSGSELGMEKEPKICKPAGVSETQTSYALRKAMVQTTKIPLV